ncbi:MAG: hypothetical protein HFG28_16285 [Eubacterium sp.]|nr:hypothetical protein [Eubacterium sp.]
MTRGNIEYNLRKSPFIKTIKEMEFRFSSENNLKKFPIKQKEHEDKLLNFFQEKYQINISNFDLLVAVLTYSKLEKRGFYIKYKDIIFTDIKQITLSLGWLYNE